ncbi:2Fe-2S iron-sulfur cluster-binding protein [uncultured Jatrophihabitans sp.]|uniref:2Fe-2S iron-sulfur cluster-binding protein n=1 Tax=uncultured Jatrophihabitans sp. TaxID=1610747 RepID=UPI0035CA7E93
MRRVDGFGRIDRSTDVKFSFDGVQYLGHRGDTLASALLANNVMQVSTSVALGRPRGVMAAGVDEASALVQVDAPFPEPMLTATTVELFDGLAAHGLPGRGALATGDDPARYDSVHAHCDVLVVGAGPAGLQTAADAATDGRRVLLVDDQPELGGSDLGTADGPDLPDLTGVRVLTRTTAFGWYQDNLVLAIEKRPESATTRQRIWRIRAGEVVVATGAHERPIAFANNDLPGVLLAGAARTYLHRYGVLVGDEIVIFTAHDGTAEVADDLRTAGAQVRVIDVRDGVSVAEALGTDRVTGIRLSTGEEIACDALLVSGGWSPAAQLYSQARGTLAWDDTIVALRPVPGLEKVSVVGAAAGHGLPTGGAVIWSVPLLDDNGPDTRFVDLQRDATVSDVLRATGAGLRSVEHVKRYTTIGTAHDQGRTSGLIAAGITAEALSSQGQRVQLEDLGHTTFRPPYVSVAFAALAGRNRGDLFDPVRTTSIHSWHECAGAVFENVGQWHRPQYYLQPGEDAHAAVRRETHAARTGVAMMDASTLGKINVQGADAAAFLDLMYTNLMSTLKVGMSRYGVMCGLDGMMFDDGTVMRISETEFVLTTTTGNAATVLDHLEDFAQTEWPELDVHLTSVTEHWATVAVVGPQSRAVVSALAPDLDVSVEAFPFLAWRDTTIGDVPVRIARISFSGELAYEINVMSWYGLALWAAVVAAGEPHGITPYGTDAMHVLRAEKGFPIIGQDTDGTVTPHDLGLGWAVSKKKPDFVGKRSFQRAENQRPDRKHLVGLLPLDPRAAIDEGAQVLAESDAGSDVTAVVPVPMLGHVTSSYDSVALGSTFALALVRSGRERIGERLYAWSQDVLTPVTVVDPVFYDKENARRDG